MLVTISDLGWVFGYSVIGEHVAMGRKLCVVSWMHERHREACGKEGEELLFR